MRRMMQGIGVLLAGAALAGALFAGPAAPAAAAPTAQAQIQELSRQGPRAGRGAPLAVRALVQATADVSGVTVDAVMAGLRNGQSLAQIAQANGKTGDDVVAAVVDKARTRLDAAVAAGRMSQARADALRNRMTAAARDAVADTTLGQQIQDRQDQVRNRQVGRALVQATADLTGLSVRDIGQRLRGGESIAQIAASAGSSANAVVAAAVDDFRATAEQAVNATSGAGQRATGALVQATADLTGLSVRDIGQRLRGGESIAQIAASAGSSANAVVAAAVDSFRTTAQDLVNRTR